MNPWKKLIFDDDGATAVEYAVMLAMILLTAISAVALFGNQAGGMWGGIGTNLSAHGF